MSHWPRIPGGLVFTRHKPGLDRAILDVPVPTRVVLPLLGYRERSLQASVVVGDTVQAGDPLGDGLVASVTGTIVAIETRAVGSRSAAAVPCIVIERDPAAGEATLEPTVITELSHDQRTRRAGIVGLGGAGFPLADKLDALAVRARDGSRGCRRLLINACECEPGIACDEALLRSDATGVAAAIESLMAWLQPQQTLFAIERDKHDALTAMNAALRNVAGVAVHAIEPVYPSGAERVLVDLIARLHDEPVLGDDERPVDRGVLCLNVATVLALGTALSGRLPNARIVTITGIEAHAGVHARVVFGTPASAVLGACGIAIPDASVLRVGGPLSGHDTTDFDMPITATTHALSIRYPQGGNANPRPCIRCGDCARVCPVALQPQQLFWHAGDQAALERHHLARCLECGCCDQVCPSELPLTATFRNARAEGARSRAIAAAADHAQRLYRRREARRARDAESPRVAQAPSLETDAETTHARTPEASAPVASGRNPAVEAALARARARAGSRKRAAGIATNESPATDARVRTDPDA